MHTPLLVTLVTTQQPIDASKRATFMRLVQGLESPQRCRRDAALELMCKSMEENNAREAEVVIDLLRIPLSSPSAATRLVAVEALARISPQGNTNGLKIVVERLKDFSELVRLAAADAVGRMVPAGHEYAISLLRGLLRHQNHVKVAALTALTEIVRNHEDRRLLDGLTRLTDHSDGSVRAAAYEAAWAMQ